MDNPFEHSVKTAWTLIVLVTAVPAVFILVIVKFTNCGASTTLFPLYVGIFLVFAFLCVSPIFQLMTKFTDNEIEQPSFFGVKTLPWQDIREISGITTGKIVLEGSDTKITINLFLYKFPRELLSAIRSRVPETVYPSDMQIDREIYRRKQNNSGRSVIGSFISIVLIIVVGKNMYAVIFGLLMAVFAVYEIRNWIKYRRLQN